MTKDKQEQTTPEQESTPDTVQQMQDLRELAQRTQANFENYRKQTEKRITDITQMAAKDVIVEILPVLDNLELAFKNQGNLEDFKQGVELIYSQLKTILQDNNVKEIDTTGQSFNPHLHEALMKEPSSKPEGEILEEFQKGFVLHDKVIRHARVKVSAGKGDN